MRKYFAFFRLKFVNSLQYRAAAAAGISTQFAWGFMEILAFKAFYETNPNAFPMEFSALVSYIWVQQAFLALFMSWFFENEIFASITTGSIAYELSRPMDLYWIWFSQSAASRLSKACLRCLPILAVALLLPSPLGMSLPESPVVFFIFIISSLLAMAVIVAFSMLIYISVFYTLSPSGVRLMYAVLADFFAGALIPLPFFPDKIRKIAELLPFAAMQNMPLRIYSGDITGGGIINGLLFQLTWLFSLVFIGRTAMNNALKRVIVQGG